MGILHLLRLIIEKEEYVSHYKFLEMLSRPENNRLGDIKLMSSWIIAVK